MCERVFISYFQAPYEILIDEDTAPDTTVFSNISVKDKDTTGANIEVECINLPEYQDACETFGVEAIASSQNSYVGAVTLRKKLNYAQQHIYEFLLKASVSVYAHFTSNPNIFIAYYY